MDYWEYIAHSQKGAERKNHRYYAREQVGTNRLGLPKYQYFYSAEEYSAYKNNQRGEKHQQRITQAKAEQVQKDAAAYRQKRQEKQERAAKRASIRNKRVGEQHSMDRKRWEQESRENARNARGEKHRNRVTSAIAEKVQKDAERYRAKRVGEQHSADRKRWASSNAKSIGEQHSADRNRWKTEAIAKQVQMDAARYRRKKANTNVRAQKVQMDAERYRKQRKAEKTANRHALKTEMDRQRRGRKHAQRVTQARAEKVQRDAWAYRRKRLGNRASNA